MRTYIQSISGVVGAMLGYALGGYTGSMRALIYFIVVDYVVGVLVAGYHGELSSKIGFKGIAKKVLILTLVSVAHSLDGLIMVEGDLLRDAVIFFYIANEAISILENIGKTSIPMPKRMKNVIQILRDQSSVE